MKFKPLEWRHYGENNLGPAEWIGMAMPGASGYIIHQLPAGGWEFEGLTYANAEEAKAVAEARYQRLLQQLVLEEPALNEMVKERDKMLMDALMGGVGYLKVERIPPEAVQVKPEVDLLAEFGKHPGWVLEQGHKDRHDEESDYGWIVYEEHGGVNDREYERLSFASSPAGAVAHALYVHEQRQKKDL